VSTDPLLATAAKNLSRGTSGRYIGGNLQQLDKWQGNAPRPQQAGTAKQGNAPKQDSKVVKDLKAKLSKAQTDLKAERLGKRPMYSHVAVSTMPLPTPAPQQQAWLPQPPSSPLVNVTGRKGDKLADALRIMAEQVAVFSAMA
jgi:hypothetical protein